MSGIPCLTPLFIDGLIYFRAIEPPCKVQIDDHASGLAVIHRRHTLEG
jgi:hypothetical protein